EASQDAVARLRELGVHIAIDDFGTGYSSLSYLKRWRVDTLKIDRSFVRDLVTDMSDLAIVSAIIAMARHLHIQVVAEGIEGWQQLEKLRTLGCAYAQGFLFARPSPAQDCSRYLSGMPLDLTQRLPAGKSTGLSRKRWRGMRQWAMPQGLQSKPPTAPPQCADAVLMVRPVCFGYNPETAASNAFQKAGEGAGDGAKARAEFDAFARALSGEGVTVCVAEDSPDPPKPDAVFPNNWVSFHGDGTL